MFNYLEDRDKSTFHKRYWKILDQRLQMEIEDAEEC